MKNGLILINMKEQFVTYEQALALKELGFDEPCLAIYSFKDLRIGIFSNLSSAYNTILAPLYQQAFRWFREKYDLNYVIVKAESWFYTINGCNTQEGFNTYEEAEDACINKLIEIANEQSRN